MPSFQKIFHPTDCSDNDLPAFAHAVKFACMTRGELTIMHVGPEDLGELPRVRPLLARWGLLPEGSAKADVGKIGIRIAKVRTIAEEADAAILVHLAAHPADLLVLSTHQREGLARLAHRAVAEPVARGSHAKTLFVPTGVKGLVSAETGALELRRILIPVAHHPNPQPAVDAAAELAGLLGSETVLFELVYLGADGEFPKVTHPERPGWTWDRLVAKGNPAEWILAVGKDFDVDLIVMATEGHHTIMDALRGSTTERVLRGARSPLLAVPA
jgi:nucleotide-binding universal stress UspA family protein